MDSKHAEAKSLLERALANVESAAGRHLRGDLGRAAAFIEDALKALDGAPVPAQPGAAAPPARIYLQNEGDGSDPESWEGASWAAGPKQSSGSGVEYIRADLAHPSSPSQDSAAAEKEFSDPGEAESPSQWAYRLGLKLDRWIPWNGVDNFQRIENAVLQFVEMKKAPARPSQDSQEVGEYPIMLVDNLRVCEGCLKGVGQMCHTPGCAFIRSRSLDMDVRESILLNGGTIRPEVAALSQSPKGAAVVGDQGREWWLKTYRKNGEEIAYQIRETAPINSRGAVIKQGWVHVREVVEAAGGESAPSAPKTGLRGAPRQEDGATLDAIRPVIEDIEDSARVAAGGFQGQPTYWTFNVFEDIRKKARALLELLPSKTKPAPGDVGEAGGDKA